MKKLVLEWCIIAAFVVIALVCGVCVGFSSCNVSRNIISESCCVRNSDSSFVITTHITESYNAAKNGGENK